jgi:hypothetical protein
MSASFAPASAPAPFLLAAHVLVSADTHAQRAALVARLDAALAPLALTGRLERVSEHDARELTAPGALAGLPVDMNPASLDDEALRPHVRTLHVRQVSNALKHLEALRRVAGAGAGAGAGAARFALVVEDDAVFGEGMSDALRRAASDAPADADLVFVGLPSTRLPPPGATASLFDDPLSLFPGQVIPACESYLVTPDAARRLADAFLPIRLATPAQLSYLFRKRVARALVAVPNAFVDGSKVGVATSSIETNNQLVWNQAYCKASELLRAGAAAGAEGQRELEALWAAQPFKDHPDCLVQRADHLAAAGRFPEAQEAYDRALEAYGAANCVVNTNSDFMRRYMATFGKL